MTPDVTYHLRDVIKPRELVEADVEPLQVHQAADTLQLGQTVTVEVEHGDAVERGRAGQWQQRLARQVRQPGREKLVP